MSGGLNKSQVKEWFKISDEDFDKKLELKEFFVKFVIVKATLLLQD